MGFIIKCRLPNASERISGVAFTRQPDGEMWSDELDGDVVERFRRIKGFRVEAPSADPVRDAILAEADALGLKLDKRLNTDKLAAALADQKSRLPPPKPPEANAGADGALGNPGAEQTPPAA